MLHQLGLVEALRAFRTGATTPDAYLSACLDASRARNPSLRAFTHLTSTLKAGEGPLGGIPVGIKDIIATADMPTANGSAIYDGQVPASDAWVTARLRSLGASILGKTVTTEFAWRHPGPTHNPWRQGHTPGGSSSGSAAAVAAGLVPLALGSQTFGSIIRPAAYCGVVGFKPSFGAIPRVGIHPLAGSLDHVGLFTRAVLDAAYALSWLAASDDGDRHGRPLVPFSVDPETGLDPLPAPRLALVRTAIWDQADPGQRALIEATARKFRAEGGLVEDIVLPERFGTVWSAARTILAAEAGTTFAPLVARFPDKTSEPLKDLVREGSALAAVAYVEALRLQARLRAELDSVLQGFDAILTLPAPGPAPEGLAFTGDPAFCVPWTYLGVPALTLPAGESPDGLPLGIQLVGPYRADLRLLRIGLWCEAALARSPRFPQDPA